MDTVSGTLLHLPQHCIDCLSTLIDTFLVTRKRAPTSEWHQLLRSMAAALPGARGLFSTLQDALRRGDRHQVWLNRRVFDSLAHFRDTLRDRPTQFRELVPVGVPVAHGVCVACQRGMGGVCFRRGEAPVVWRFAFPPAIRQALVTNDNRHSTVSISDLELAGTLAHKHALVVQLAPGDHCRAPHLACG